jgi:signal transduction histidine kinase
LKLPEVDVAFVESLGQGPRPRLSAYILRLPLAGKIVGANALIVVTALVLAAATHAVRPPGSRLTLIVGAALVLALAVNVILVVLALRPLGDIEVTASRVWRGDLTARVPRSRLADVDLERVGSAFNTILDGLTADRVRVRELAARVIRAGDEERAGIARELHDSTAQSVAAIVMELGVLARTAATPLERERLERLRRIANDVVDEVRLLAHSVHPRVLEDLGLGAAMQLLAREAAERSGIRVELLADGPTTDLDRTVTSVLYRVAQEALNNAIRHADAGSISVTLDRPAGAARLQVLDDGSGFRIEEAEQRRRGMGLFTMRERLALVSGSLDIESAPGRGTRVVATVPDGVPAVAPTRGGQ